jgi:hypothetical protein
MIGDKPVLSGQVATVGTILGVEKYTLHNNNGWI